MVTHCSHFIHYNVFCGHFARKRWIKIRHFAKKERIFTDPGGRKKEMCVLHKKAERFLGALLRLL